MDLLSVIQANKDVVPSVAQIRGGVKVYDMPEQLRGAESFSDSLSEAVNAAIEPEKPPGDESKRDKVKIVLEAPVAEVSGLFSRGVIPAEQGKIFAESSTTTSVAALRSGAAAESSKFSQPSDAALAGNDRAQSTEDRLFPSAKIESRPILPLAKRPVERVVTELDNPLEIVPTNKFSKNNRSLSTQNLQLDRRTIETSWLPDTAMFSAEGIQDGDQAPEGFRRGAPPKVFLVDEGAKKSDIQWNITPRALSPSIVPREGELVPTPSLDKLLSVEVMDAPRDRTEAKMKVSGPSIVLTSGGEMSPLRSKADSTLPKVQKNHGFAVTGEEAAKTTPHQDFERSERSNNPEGIVNSKVVKLVQVATATNSSSITDEVLSTLPSNPGPKSSEGPNGGAEVHLDKSRQDKIENLFEQKAISPETLLRSGKTELRKFDSFISRPIERFEIKEISSDAVNASGDDPLRSPNTTMQVRTTLPNPVSSAHAVFLKNLDTMVGAVVGSAPGEVEISLSPEDLGRLRFRMTIQETGLIIHVAADRPETADIIRRNAAILEDALGGEGFETVDFHFEQDRQPTGMEWKHETTEEQEEAGAQMGFVMGRRLSDRALDLKV